MSSGQALLFALSVAAAVLTIAGLVAITLGTLAVLQFARRAPAPVGEQPPVTVLKPLCGDEPALEEALATICCQTYPEYQIVFGVQAADDPALATVEKLRSRFPDHAIDVVIDERNHGANRKISNLINMIPVARHDLLVFSDSDLHVAPDYLERIVATLNVSNTGLVTTVCVGLPTGHGPISRLGASGLSHSFLPSVLMSRVLGREDCLGTTMALRRHVLERVGELAGLVCHLADDNVLSQRVLRLGLNVRLADTVPLTAVPEETLHALYQHELRWARTNRSLEPMAYAASVVLFPIFWAAVAVVASAAAPWSLGLFGAAWAVRALAAYAVDTALVPRDRPECRVPVWLLPFRDALSTFVVVSSYWSCQVIWRGSAMVADIRR